MKNDFREHLSFANLPIRVVIVIEKSGLHKRWKA